SVAVLGNTAETTFGNNFNFDREQIQQFIDQQFGFPGGRGGDNNGGPGGPGGQDFGNGRGRGGQGGFPGGGRGGNRGNQGGRGGNGNGGFAFGRGGRGFGTTAPRGNLSYQLRDSDLDAAPFSITGNKLPKSQ